MLLTFLEKRLHADANWLTALVSSGHPGAASEPESRWLVGPSTSWEEQPLLGALEQKGFVEAVWPAHTPGRHASLGVPLDHAHRVRRAVKQLASLPPCRRQP